MPVDTTHPLYNEYIERWTRCRDCVEGSDAIKRKGEIYLPKLSAQSYDDYNAYKKRANFVGVTARALSGLVGMVIRRSPTLRYPEKLSPLFTSSVTHDTFSEVFQFFVTEILLQGRAGALVDIDEETNLAYVIPYSTESIINWRITGGKLDRLILSESVYEEDEKDEYEMIAINQIREYRVIDGRCLWAIYRKASTGKYEVRTSGEMKVRGRAIDYVPFVAANVLGLSIIPTKPPMMDIVDVNLSHYRTSADLENGRHFVALPTPVVTGVSNDTPLRIGSETAWVLPAKEAKAFYLEFLGGGLSSLENAMKEKVAQMAQFSARLVDLAGKGSEAAETVKLRYSSESANLSTTARVVEQALVSLFAMAAELSDVDPSTILVELNKEFLETKLSFQELRELVKAYVDGGIDKETLLYNLERGEMLPPESK